MSALDLDIDLSLGEFRLSLRHYWSLSGINGIFGPSGSGKTTLLRIISGLERGAHGRVAFGTDLWQNDRVHVAPHERRIAYVFQDGRLFPHLDVEGNLKFPQRFAGSAGWITLGDVTAALDLGPLLQRSPGTLSGGERQRVAIARALLSNPRLILMDEPASSLDIARKREVVRLIESLPALFDIPVVYVTHDINELVRLCNEVVLLDDGHIVDSGAVSEVMQRHELVDDRGQHTPGAVVEGVISEHTQRMTMLALGEQSLRIPRIDVSEGQTIRLRIHAKDVVIACDRPHRLSIRNVLEAEVLELESERDHFCEVQLGVDGHVLRALITHDALDELGLERGQTVFALIKSVALDDYPLF